MTVNEITVDLKNRAVNVSFEGYLKTFDDDQVHTLLILDYSQTDINICFFFLNQHL